MAGIGDIQMSSNFELNSQRPSEAKYLKADIIARNASPFVQRYDGYPVYVESTKQTFILKLGTVDTDLANNANWVETTIVLGTTNVSNFVNDANYISTGDNISDLINDSNYVAAGDNVSDLINDSNYVSVGDNVSDLVNDAGYLTASQATELAAGIAELATQVETDAGTDDERIVTPLKLRNTVFVLAQIPSLPGTIITSGTIGPAFLPGATTTTIGASQLATQTQVDDGVNTIHIVTPATLQTKLDNTIVLPGAWVTPTLNGAWVNTDLQYRFLDPYLIQIRGNATGDTITPTVFTLPVGFRPITQIRDTVIEGTPAISYLTIAINGNITIANTVNNNYYFNIIFPVD